MPEEEELLPREPAETPDSVTPGVLTAEPAGDDVAGVVLTGCIAGIGAPRCSDGQKADVVRIRVSAEGTSEGRPDGFSANVVTSRGNSDNREPDR